MLSGVSRRPEAETNNQKYYETQNYITDIDSPARQDPRRLGDLSLDFLRADSRGRCRGMLDLVISNPQIRRRDSRRTAVDGGDRGKEVDGERIGDGGGHESDAACDELRGVDAGYLAAFDGGSAMGATARTREQCSEHHGDQSNSSAEGNGVTDF